MFYLSAAILLCTYAAIVSGAVDKTKAALGGAAITLALKVLEQSEAFHSMDMGVDWNVVFLLINMMILVGVLAGTGVFQYLAIKAAKSAKGEPMRIMLLLSLITAVGSAFLDNVTTVLLLSPVTLLLCEQLDLDPSPMLITLALAANIGGAATLIGDPPNILIASRADLSFMDFLEHVAPPVVGILLLWLVAWRFVLARRLRVDDGVKARVMALDEQHLIKNKPLLHRSLVILALTIAGFMLHGVLDYEPATVALLGAAAVLLVSRQTPEQALDHVEWPTIFFFIGLFIVIGGTIKSGLMEHLSQGLISLTSPGQGNMLPLTLAMAWFSAFASAVVDNIPFVATMAPLLLDLSNSAHVDHAAMEPVWWALSLGACLGGNATMVGASANVIVTGQAAKAGHPISFGRFMAYGLPVALASIAISSAYLYVRYY